MVATTKQPNRTPVIRVLTDCYAGKAEGGARGLSDGKASTCVRNQRAAREVVVAVGLYSGLDSETMTFELVATNPLGELMLSTPAISEGVLYFRTNNNIIAIGQ